MTAPHGHTHRKLPQPQRLPSQLYHTGPHTSSWAGHLSPWGCFRRHHRGPNEKPTRNNLIKLYQKHGTQKRDECTRLKKNYWQAGVVISEFFWKCRGEIYHYSVSEHDTCPWAVGWQTTLFPTAGLWRPCLSWGTTQGSTQAPPLPPPISSAPSSQVINCVKWPGTLFKEQKTELTTKWQWRGKKTKAWGPFSRVPIMLKALSELLMKL